MIIEERIYDYQIKKILRYKGSKQINKYFLI